MIVSKGSWGRGLGVNLLSVVQEVVGQVVADVPEDAAAENRRGCVPVVGEEVVCQVVEWRREDEEKRWGHDES